MDEATRYETARQCAQRFNPPSPDALANTIAESLKYELLGQGLMDDITESVGPAIAERLCGSGLALDIAEAVAKATKERPAIPADAVCFFMDGNAMCCVRGNFRNSKDSPAGFGTDRDSAYLALVMDEKKENEKEKKA